MKLSPFVAWAALALLLAVSGARADPVAGPLSAQIIDWPAGSAGEVQLGVAYFSQNANDHLTTVIATAPVDAQGRFTLTLPSSVGLEATLPGSGTTYTFQNSCQGKVTASPAARINFFTLEAYQDGLHLSAVKLRSTQNAALKAGDGLAALAFASAPTTLSGAVTCNPGGKQEIAQTWAAPLVAGWNLLWGGLGAAKDGRWQVSLTGKAVPKTAFWHLYEGYGGVGMAVEPNPDGSAVVVYSVVPGGAAETAGVKVGDQIVAVDGFQIQKGDDADVGNRVRGDAGVPVTLTLKRGTQTLTLKIVRRFIRG